LWRGTLLGPGVRVRVAAGGPPPAAAPPPPTAAPLPPARGPGCLDLLKKFLRSLDSSAPGRLPGRTTREECSLERKEVITMKPSSSPLPALIAGLALTALPFVSAAAEPPTGATVAQSAGATPVKAAAAPSPRKSIDRFSATTTGMTPKDVSLRMNLLRWSDDAGRADVVAALGASDPTAALLELPTLGHIWLGSSPVGFSVKYARRTPLPDGGERVTFVTEKRLDYYELKKWVPAPPVAAKDTSYGVIELYLDANGQGTGTLSLVADVQVDAAKADVALAQDAPKVLANAKAEPKPYWERAAGASG
jgi:hypothetical protein